MEQAFLFSQNGSVEAIHLLHDPCQCTQSLGFRRTSRISASLELSGGLCMYSHLQGEGKFTQTAQLAAPSPAPGCVWTGLAFSKDAKLHTQLILLAEMTDMITNHKSVKRNNNATSVDGKNVSFIFLPTFGKAARTRKKERAMPHSPQGMQVYLQKSLNKSLVTHWYHNEDEQKKEPQNLTVTQDLLPESGLEALQVFIESWF